MTQPTASDILAIRKMFGPQAEAYLRHEGYSDDEIAELRPTMGRSISSIKTQVHDPYRPMFMAIMYHRGVPYRVLGRLYGVSHSTAYSLIQRVPRPERREIKHTISFDELQAYQRAFYDHVEELTSLPIADAAQRLDELAVEYLDT